MKAGKLRCFLDVFRRENLSGKIRSQDVLESGHFGVVEKTTARAHIGIDESRMGRVLPPMAEFVAVGVQDRIQSQGLDGGLLFRV
jgi:hypothetical protein